MGSESRNPPEVCSSYFLEYKILILVFFRVLWKIVGKWKPKTALKKALKIAIWVFLGV